jgi:hypothetical protein
VEVRSVSETGGPIEIRLDKVDGPLLAQVKIGNGSDWKVVTSKLDRVAEGVHNLFVVQKENNKVDLDWISFK